MKKTQQHHQAAVQAGAPSVRMSAIASATLLALSAGAVQAQQAALDTVTITGIRRGIEEAISVKKNSDSIVEAISAEDIGKLPDSSIAESIARLPGVTAQRVAGKAQNISVRGMSSDFSTALLNGREQVSTGDNRGVEFDQYPSELLSAVVIHKTPDGRLIGQGLSGTIDLQTVRPLAFGKRAFAVNLRGEKSGVGTDFTGNGNRFNISYIDQFADRTVGVALGYARYQSKVTTARAETYDTNNTFNLAGTDIKVINGYKLFNDSNKETRDGFMGVLEFKPGKNFNSVLDLYYSKFDKDLVRRGLELQVADNWRGAADPRFPGLENAVVDSNNRLVSGTWLNVNPLSRTIWEPRKDELKAVGWNNKLTLSDGWSAIGDLSYSQATRKENITEIESGVIINGQPGFERVGVANGQITSLQYNHGDPSIVKLMDPESWGQNGYDKLIKTDDKLKAARLTLQRDLNDGWLSKVQGGVNITDRTKTKDATENKLILKGGVGSFADLPAGASAVNVGGSNFASVSFDPSAAMGNYNLVPNLFADIFLKSWDVKEKTTTLFTKADVDTTLAGKQVRGNVGLQVINTDQSSTAPSVDLSNQSVATLQTQGKKYSDILPSLNLAMDLGDDQTLRFGAARVMARARMDQLSAGRRAEVKTSNGNTWEGSGGNPLLDPFRANAVDLSYEKYFGTKAYFSAAAFYKQLKSYIFDFTDNAYDFSNFVNLSNNVPSGNLGKFTQPRNGKGGSISGVELAVSVPFKQLTPMLDGFGVVASYADTSSKITPFGDSDTRPLPGLSKQVSSLTFYYEANGFSARIAQRSRSNFLGEVTGFGASREYTFIKAETITDLQLGYEFQSGPAKGLSSLLQVNNLTNTKYQRYQGSPDNIIDTVKYGKSILFGLTYKL
ncbi:MAG: hypothetical protein RLY71_2151 [Pseudomonadota bacterium]